MTPHHPDLMYPNVVVLASSVLLEGRVFTSKLLEGNLKCIQCTDHSAPWNKMRIAHKSIQNICGSVTIHLLHLSAMVLYQKCSKPQLNATVVQ